VEGAIRVARLDAALDLIETHASWMLPALRRHVDRILVIPLPAAWGRWLQEHRTMMLAVELLDEPPAEIASTIVHELTHARLHALRVPLGTAAEHARGEWIATKAEIRFLRRAAPGTERDLLWRLDHIRAEEHTAARQRARVRAAARAWMPPWVLRVTDRLFPWTRSSSLTARW
jgi:hypothetical protein